MAALAQQTKGNPLLSRFKAFLTFQKFNHNIARRQKQHSANMGSASLLDTGEIDFSKWRKLQSRDFGIKNSMIPTSASIVLKVLQRGGFEAYLVGGCVRDLILRRIPKDFDVITTATLQQIKKHFRRALIVGRRFPICRVHISGSIVEVSSFGTMAKHTGKGEKLPVPKMPRKFHQKDFMLWKDSMRRDFTVNSLFFDPSVNAIYDYADAMVDLKSLQLRTLVPAHLSFEEDCARILRGFRLAARLNLSFSEEIEIAVHKLSPSIMRLDKSRLLMEVNYMLSYGAAEPSLSLLQRYNILGMLLPVHAAHVAQQSNKQLSGSSVLLMKLFSSLDQLVNCDRPSHDSLWAALLAFHLALITDPQEAFVVMTFASVLYHGNWKEGVKFARKHSDAASIYAPEISVSQGSMSDDELVERVKELAVLVRKSVDILTDKDHLQGAMSKFPGSPCFGLVFVSRNLSRSVEVIFDVLIEDIRSLKNRRNSFEIDYTLLGQGQTHETRFVLGKVILDTIAPGVIPSSEVIKHSLAKVDTQLSKDATKEEGGGIKKRKFVYEDDIQPNASSEIKRHRAEKQKSVVEKHDKESVNHNLDNNYAVTKKKTKGEHGDLPQNGTRMALQSVNHQVPHLKEQKDQQTSVNNLKLLFNVANGATTKQYDSKEKHDSTLEKNNVKSELIHRRKQDLQEGKLASDEKSKPKAGKRSLSDLFRR